jgi:uncharacterized protein (DUF433 family)
LGHRRSGIRARGPDAIAFCARRWVYTFLAMVTRLSRITIDPEICTGKPCIRGLRFPVSRLLGLLAAGQSREQILAGYPYLESEDIDETLAYAASLAEDESVELAHG